MRPNPMRAGLERGELQLGTWINMIRNPAILPLLKAAGLDFARVDMEHSSPSMETIADMAVVIAAALDHLDEIAAMDGIDALTLGPADLAQDLGVFGTPDQARVLDQKRDLILGAAKKYGKTCSMLVTSAEQARQWKEEGALLLVYLSDVELLHTGFTRAMAGIRGG
jgi:2-keto-3-deoxy-L-rhamnonate aldolase RhmA